MRHNTWKEKISRYVDNELDEKDSSILRTHLERCLDCKHFYNESLSLSRALATLTPTEDLTFEKKVDFEKVPYYRYVPQRRFSPILKPIYALATILIIFLGFMLFQETYMPGSINVARKIPVIKRYLEDGSVTIDTTKFTSHIIIVTPWATIEPEGTFFVVTQTASLLEVNVVSGRVLIKNKLNYDEKVKVVEGNTFSMDKTGKFSIVPIGTSPEVEKGTKTNHEIAVESRREIK